MREDLNLFGFNQLEVLNLTGTDEVTSLNLVGDLPALRKLHLHNYEHLLWLPNLSTSRNLQELMLEECCALELHEEDIQMLSKLPLLQPITYSTMEHGCTWMLDLAQRKVFVCSRSWDLELKCWILGEFEEQDLGAPPIKIERFDTSELDSDGE